MPTSTLTFQGEVVKCTIPKELYLAIAKIEVEKQTDWERACAESVKLLNTGSETFKKRVAAEARRLYDSELMKGINKARKTMRERAFDEGVTHARLNESNFQVPCSKCGKLMYFSNRDAEWDKERSQLIAAFSNWSHIKCQ